MIRRTEAIVLRSMEYGETSRIVTLFTRESGKLSVLAKGARLTKSRYGSTLLPMAYTQIVYYHKPSRSLQMLRESAHVQAFHGIAREMEKIATGLRIVELVNALMAEEDAHPLVFNLLLQVLHRLDEAPERGANLLPYFQLRLAATLGFAPAIDREAVAALPEEGGLLALDAGRILAPGAAYPAARHATRGALRAFAIYARAEAETILRMNVQPGLRQEVDDLIDAYLRYHVEEAIPTRGRRVTARLLEE